MILIRSLQKSKPQSYTLNLIMKLISLILSLITLTSCTVVPSGPPAPFGPQMGAGGEMVQTGIETVDNGHQGGFIQKHHADGTPDGPPVWVPGPPPSGKTYNGLRLEMKPTKNIPHEELQAFLGKFQ